MRELVPFVVLVLVDMQQFEARLAQQRDRKRVRELPLVAGEKSVG